MSGLVHRSSIIERMPQALNLVLSFNLVVSHLLVEHVSIQLLLFHLLGTNVLIFPERVHFIEVIKINLGNEAHFKTICRELGNKRVQLFQTRMKLKKNVNQNQSFLLLKL